jgi:signal transduction histidine kinase
MPTRSPLYTSLDSTGEVLARRAQRPTPLAATGAERAGFVLRVALLALIAGLSIITTQDARALVWIALLGAASLPAWAARPRIVPVLGRIAEVIITALGASALASHHSGAAASTILPYLTIPIVIPAIEGRLRESLALVGLGLVALTAAGAADGLLDDDGFLLSCAEWLSIAGLLACFVHAVRRLIFSPQAAEPPAVPPPYAEATRLLTQLRTVARQLPGATLDPGGLSEHLIEAVRVIAPVDRAAVLSASGGGRLVVLAQMGAERVDWETSLDADSAIADAWASQQPQVTTRSQARTARRGEVSTLVVPLVAGVRTIGLMTMETDKPGAYSSSLVAQVAETVSASALRLEAALLFDDVRSIATNEERQRLAREIHDGVAQELVMVGYGIDNALASLPDQAVESAEELRSLRNEVTRVITELRLSLFELRSEVDRQGGLTAAIAEYARTVGSSAGLRVHLSLDDSSARLPAATEAELLRIAQEAITNARKHAGAHNLWVTCEVDPPYARIEVSDDGSGMSTHRSDGRYGLAIMAERAERIRGQLEIKPRSSGGTSVAVVIGASPRRGSL